MRESLDRAVAEIEANPPALDSAQIAESVAFLRWLGEEHFTFLGYRAYDLRGEAGEETLTIVPGSGLGILREESPAGSQPGESPRPSPACPRSCASGRAGPSCCC